MADKTVGSLTIRAQSGVERTLYATWSFTETKNGKNVTASYSWVWHYMVDGVWFEGSTGSSSPGVRSCTYSVPGNASRARCRVKPVSKTYKKNKKDKTYFTGKYCSWKSYNMPGSDVITPETPSAPNVSIKNLKLTASIDIYDTRAEYVRYEVVKNNTEKVSGDDLYSKITNARSSVQFDVEAGFSYKVRCQAYKPTTTKQKVLVTPGSKVDPPVKILDHKVSGWYSLDPVTENHKRIAAQYTTINKQSSIDSEWSQYSSEVYSPPAAVTEVSAKPLTANSIEVSWRRVATAESYEVQYTTDTNFFDKAPDAVTTGTPEWDQTNFIIQNLGTGAEDHTYYVRVRAVRENEKSEWSKIVSATVGRKPDPPTTWTITTTVKVGQDIYLFWTHNATDGSRATESMIGLTVDGVSTLLPTIKNTVAPELDTGTYHYLLDTDAYPIGASVMWHVKTKGAVDEWSEWSIQRTIDIYAPPQLTMALGSSVNWYWDELNFVNGVISETEGDIVSLEDNTLTSFPLFIVLSAGPKTQTPVGYYISITALDTYEDMDETGRTIYVHEGEEIFSRFYDKQTDWLQTVLSANDVNLANGSDFAVHATVVMDSGLEATADRVFSVDWAEETFDIDGNIAIDPDVISAHIEAWAYAVGDENQTPIDGIEIAIYRRNFDGEFLEISSGLNNLERTTVIDPHPSLNYARYRVVAKSLNTGAISFYDLPAEPIGETSIIIQWDEAWANFDYNGDTEDAFAVQPWDGSFLRLPWNVDIQDQNSVDVTLSEYIGRRHPVSYYGTQVGQSASWRCDIDKYDEETLYALRRLSVYMGDVYVREPSGTGYWAQINVSYSKNHKEVVAPVTLTVTRVEGGI